LVALEAIGNADNVGAVFRNARAFGVEAVVCGPACCDPLYRKAIRVSIGASLLVPYATSESPKVRESKGQTSGRHDPAALRPCSGRPRACRGGEERTDLPVREDPVEGRTRGGGSTWTSDLMALKAAGLTLVALTPAPDAVDLNEFVACGTSTRIVLLVGHEGEGLSPEALRLADVRVRIAMAAGVDSLNVATATGIALHGIHE
jgi:tRNA G18 (ribose-2'-O)-methylase SpoU